MDRTSVESAIQRARAAGVDYPTYASTLAATGVRRYHTDVSSHTTTFSGDAGSFQAAGDPIVSAQERTPMAFDRAGVQAAIRANQQGATDFPTFLRQIWNAGVTHYDADLVERVITYAGSNGDTYIEQIPAAPPH